MKMMPMITLVVLGGCHAVLPLPALEDQSDSIAAGVDAHQDGPLPDSARFDSMVDISPDEAKITPRDHVVFATSTTYTGNCGGPSKADDICAGLAAAAKRPEVFVALMSDRFTNAKDRVSITRPIFNTGGQQVAADAAELWGGVVSNTIDYDESGILLESVFSVWTGSDDDGIAYPKETSLCLDWTSNETWEVGEVGTLNDKELWIDAEAIACNKQARIYCISQ